LANWLQFLFNNNDDKNKKENIMFNKVLAVFTVTAISWNSFADSNSDLTNIIDQHWQNAKKKKYSSAPIRMAGNLMAN
jgi:hypothetical protein